MKRVCICGGGSLGHVTAGYLSATGAAEVSLLTRKPEEWSSQVNVFLPDGGTLEGKLYAISSDPDEAAGQADIVLLCLPGFAIRPELEKLRGHIRPDAYVGSVFSSTGFFFEAMKILPESQPLWGFQRVPFIARTSEYGKSARLLGYKDSYSVAVEHVRNADREEFARWVSDAFSRPVHLLKNMYEASLTNSNPILHTSRLYSMFHGWTPEKRYGHDIMFYEEWDEESAETLIRMDREFFRLLDKLPVTKGYLPTILDYYESSDAKSLAAKLSSIPAFKGIATPMVNDGSGWIPDFTSRYFTEDFPFGLRYIRDLGTEKGISMPTIEKVYRWGTGIFSGKAIGNEPAKL